MKISNYKKLQTAEICFLFEAIIMAVKLATDLSDAVDVQYNLVLAFATIGFSDIMSSLRYKRSNKFEHRKFLGVGILLLIGAVLTAFLPTFPAFCVAFCIFSLSLMYSRILKIFLKRKVSNTIWNIILFFLSLFFLTVPVIGDEELLLICVVFIGLTMMVQVLVRMIGISMSKIRFDILKRIFLKSMASEVFFGLMILVVTFSVVFQATEPNIDNFFDGLWYCFALITTIGFGDITAVSAIGRILSVILGLYGLIVVSLITSIIINFYNETKDFVMNDEGESETEPDDNSTQPPADKAPDKESIKSRDKSDLM